MKPMLFKIALAIVVLAVVALWLVQKAGTISGAQARQLVDQGARLVDVRSPEEYAGGHIDGAVNIPVGQIEARASELGDKHGSIVVYCRSGARSSRAKAALESAGFTAVENLGAMSSW